jgi:hypothetical protein
MSPSTFKLCRVNVATDYSLNIGENTSIDIKDDIMVVVASGSLEEIDNQVNSSAVSNALSVLFEYPWIDSIEFKDNGEIYILGVSERKNHEDKTPKVVKPIRSSTIDAFSDTKY